MQIAAEAVQSEWMRADTLAVIGIALTFLGFVATLVQLSKVKSAANAATDAATKTQTRLAYNHLLLLIPQLERIDNDLSASVQANNHELTAHHLSAWRWQANVFRTLLSKVKHDQPELFEKIQSSVVACSATKLKLQPTVTLDKATSHVRRTTADVVDQLGAVATLLSNAEETA